MMSDKKLRQKLIDLGAENLADALLKIASGNDVVSDFIDHNVSSPKENINRIKSKLRSLRKSHRFINWKESKHLAQEMENLLQDLKVIVKEPERGVKLLYDFFENDHFIFERCDDSNGLVGYVFTFTASELFAEYAGKCKDRAWLIDQIKSLYAKDDYGVRFSLIEKAKKYLSKKEIRKLVNDFWKEAKSKTEGSYEKHHWLSGIQSLAEQLKDAKLYESAYLQIWSELSTAACLDIARIYLETGDAETALSWVEKIEEEDHFRANDQNKLLLVIYKKLGKQEKTTELAWRIFRRYRSQDTLKDVLFIVGEDKRDQIITDECSKILDELRWSPTNANFLIQIDRINEADNYIIIHREQLNGDYFESLLPLAKSMEKHKRFLPATMIYRALLESILRRAQSKYYHHGVKYLKKLDELSLRIKNWYDIIAHQEYFNVLLKNHNRKVSFWSKYNR